MKKVKSQLAENYTEKEREENTQLISVVPKPWATCKFFAPAFSSRAFTTAVMIGLRDAAEDVMLLILDTSY